MAVYKNVIVSFLPQIKGILPQALANHPHVCKHSVSFALATITSEICDWSREDVLNWNVYEMKERCEIKFITGNRMGQCRITIICKVARINEAN